MVERRYTFEQIVDHLPEVVWLLDGDLREILYTNPAYERLLEDLSPNAKWPLDAETLVHPEDTPRAEEWIETIQEDIRSGTWKDEYPFEARLTEKAGGDHWLETIGVPLTENGEVVGFAGISTDITDHILREQELESKVTQLDQFVSMITHDIRNPLTVAKANLEMYKMGHEADRLENIEDSLDRIDELTLDIAALARDGDDSKDARSVQLETIAGKAWETIDQREAVLETEPGTIGADPTMLQTLLENLFRNAVGHGGFDVTVRVQPLPDGFRVEDTGSGIAKDLREQVMEHGFTSGYSGSGIGLTIVQRIAEDHGWCVSLGESAEGGARFEFREC